MPRTQEQPFTLGKGTLFTKTRKKWQRSEFSRQCWQQEFKVKSVSVEKAAEALGAKLTALAAEVVAEAMAEKVRVKEELLSRL